MTAKQTPLVDLLRLHAEDLHSKHGHNKSARLLSQAADEIDRLRANNAELLTDLDRVLTTLRYLIGIAERGEGRPMTDEETAESFVLRYVKRLEAELADADRDEGSLPEAVCEAYGWLWHSMSGDPRVNRARTVADVAQVLVNSAKIEVEHMKVAADAYVEWNTRAALEETK